MDQIPYVRHCRAREEVEIRIWKPDGSIRVVTPNNDWTDGATVGVFPDVVSCPTMARPPKRPETTDATRWARVSNVIDGDIHARYSTDKRWVVQDRATGRIVCVTHRRSRPGEDFMFVCASTRFEGTEPTPEVFSRCIDLYDDSRNLPLEVATVPYAGRTLTGYFEIKSAIINHDGQPENTLCFTPVIRE